MPALLEPAIPRHGLHSVIREERPGPSFRSGSLWIARDTPWRQATGRSSGFDGMPGGFSGSGNIGPSGGGGIGGISGGRGG
jgi:hypothetical protein